RASPRHARESRRTHVVARTTTGLPRSHHLQRGGEPPDARHQRGDRIRPHLVRGCVEEGSGMTGIVITEMVVPPAADAPDAGEFRAMVDISNRVAEADTGIDDLNDTPEQLL